MCKASQLIAGILFFMLPASTWADLSVDSAYPKVGKVGEDVSVIVRGGGFDENTRVSVSLDTGNQGHIIRIGAYAGKRPLESPCLARPPMWRMDLAGCRSWM